MPRSKPSPLKSLLEAPRVREAARALARPARAGAAPRSAPVLSYALGGLWPRRADAPGRRHHQARLRGRDRRLRLRPRGPGSARDGRGGGGRRHGLPGPPGPRPGVSALQQGAPTPGRPAPHARLALGLGLGGQRERSQADPPEAPPGRPHRRLREQLRRPHAGARRDHGRAHLSRGAAPARRRALRPLLRPRRSRLDRAQSGGPRRPSTAPPRADRRHDLRTRAGRGRLPDGAARVLPGADGTLPQSAHRHLGRRGADLRAHRRALRLPDLRARGSRRRRHRGKDDPGQRISSTSSPWEGRSRAAPCSSERRTTRARAWWPARWRAPPSAWPSGPA